MSLKEGIKSGDYFAGISLILGVLTLSQFAFSKSSRMKIGDRDGCKKSFKKGWMVHSNMKIINSILNRK